MFTKSKFKDIRAYNQIRLSGKGFTLVELLVVISILGILMAIVVGAIRGANQDTLVSKTRGTIAKIDSVLNDRYDEYLTVSVKFAPPPSPTDARVDRFPISNATVSQIVDNSWSAYFSPSYPPISLLRERVRIAATRDLMRMEMPDCVADLLTGGTDPRSNPPGVRLATGFQRTIPPNTVTSLVMQVDTPQRFLRMFDRVNSVPGWSATNSNSELLYMIVEDSTLNGGSALEVFGTSEIADTDGDGLLEFVDAWGNPIRWLRWPAGYRSVAKLNPDPLAWPTLPTDPLDPTQADVGLDLVNRVATGDQPFRPGDNLRPLVVSAGSDGKFGLRFNFSNAYVTGFATNPSRFSTSQVSWPLVGALVPLTPSGPGYLSSGFNWPDPFHPRINVNTSPLPKSNYALGGVLNVTEDLLRSDGEIVGVDTSGATSYIRVDIGLSASLTDTQVNNIFQAYADDNVTNLDESGASL